MFDRFDSQLRPKGDYFEPYHRVGSDDVTVGFETAAWREKVLFERPDVFDMVNCDACGENASSRYQCPACGGIYCASHRAQADHNCVGAKTGLWPYFPDRLPVETGGRSRYAYVFLLVMAVIVLSGVAGLLAAVF